MKLYSDEYWMNKAFAAAKKAYAADEVPVGCVIVSQHHQLLATAHNCSISHNDPTAHAEIVALRKAAKKINNYRLVDTTLYVTLEPCLMCVSAMVHARIKKIVFAADDPKTGAVISRIKALDFDGFNHRIDYSVGVLSTECSNLLKQFFKEKRQ